MVGGAAEGAPREFRLTGCLKCRPPEPPPARNSYDSQLDFFAHTSGCLDTGNTEAVFNSGQHLALSSSRIEPSRVVLEVAPIVSLGDSVLHRLVASAGCLGQVAGSRQPTSPHDDDDDDDDDKDIDLTCSICAWNICCASACFFAKYRCLSQGIEQGLQVSAHHRDSSGACVSTPKKENVARAPGHTSDVHRKPPDLEEYRRLSIAGSTRESPPRTSTLTLEHPMSPVKRLRLPTQPSTLYLPGTCKNQKQVEVWGSS